MINILSKDYEFNHDIYEFIRVFFPYAKFNVIESFEDYRDGYLIKMELETIGDDLYAISHLFFNKNLVSTYKENTNKINVARNKEKTLRIGIKKSLFDTLSDGLNKSHSWGILTGIRPTKVIHDLIQKDLPLNRIKEILNKDYKISLEKINLLIEISNNQMEYLYPLDLKKFSLYIGIPFCPSRCTYCSFPSLSIEKYNCYINEYVEKLIYEIKNIKEFMSVYTINTVYIGGGTPTSIPVEKLREIIRVVYDNFGKESIKEFTVEAGRPDTINKVLLGMLYEEGINRISINPQSMNDNTLKLIGRNHSHLDIIEAYDLAKKMGIDIINMDLIVGLPNEGVKEIKNTLKIIRELNPDNLTIHTLAIKRGSNFDEHKDEILMQNQNTIKEMLKETNIFANQMNLKPYYLYRQKNMLGNFENIGYSKAGLECIYNISIMEEKESIVGAGVGSTTKIYNPENNSLNRIFNFKSIKEYLTRIDEEIDKKRDLIMGKI